MNVPYRLSLLLAAGFALAACDGVTGPDPASDVALGAVPEVGGDSYCTDGHFEDTYPVNSTHSVPGHNNPFDFDGAVHLELDIVHVDDDLVRVEGSVEANDVVIDNGYLTFIAGGEEAFEMTVNETDVVTQTLSFTAERQGGGQDYRLDVTLTGERTDCGLGNFGVRVEVTRVHLVRV
jgi:hypothetical protein